jgi:hypothetical protein
MRFISKHIQTIIGLALGLNVAYILFAFVLANAGVLFYGSEFFKISSLDSLIHLKFRFDSGWYETIANNGHHKITPDLLAPIDNEHWRQSYYAFFPLYPLTVKGLQLLTGLSYGPAAYIFSYIISIVAFVVFYLFTKRFTASPGIALTSTMVLMLSPFTFFFSMALTEAYYLALLAGAFLGVYNKNLLLIALCSALLVLVRPNGIVTLLPLGLFYIERHVFEGAWRWPVQADFVKLLPGLVLLIMPLVFFAYCFYLKEMTGDFFAFSTAQKGWGKAYANPAKVLLKPRGWRWAIEAGISIGVFALSFFNRKKIPLSMHVLLWISIILPLWAGKTQSLPRYISVIFPIFIIAGMYLNNKPRLKMYTYAGLTVLHIVTFYFWLSSDYLAC